MKLSKGFTLIELIVVSSIVVIIITVAIDLFVSIVQYQRKVLSEQEISSQMSYVIEYMSRAIRMAKKDDNGFCLGLGYEGSNYKITFIHEDEGMEIGQGIRFINHSDNDICQEFFWNSKEKTLKESKNNGPFLPLISDKLWVNFLKFNLVGELGSDSLQPRVTIFMEIQIKGAGNQPKKQIQTTISQRNIDL